MSTNAVMYDLTSNQTKRVDAWDRRVSGRPSIAPSSILEIPRGRNCLPIMITSNIREAVKVV